MKQLRDVGPDPYIRPLHLTLGLDLGQTADNSALCLVETEVRKRVQRDAAGGDIRLRHEGIEHRVRDVERLPLGMPYPLQAEHVRGYLGRLPQKADLVVDSTGLGRPILEILEAAGLKPVGVVITAGQGEVRAGERLWRVPKELLVQRVNAPMHSGEVVFAEDLEDAAGLRRELLDFQVSYTAAGHLTWAARPGAHDDRVMALAVALWWAQRQHGRGSEFSAGRLLMCPGG